MLFIKLQSSLLSVVGIFRYGCNMRQCKNRDSENFPLTPMRRPNFRVGVGNEEATPLYTVRSHVELGYSKKFVSVKYR